jgi:hypothetical protein
MKIERRGRSAVARQADEIDPISEAFGFSGGWGIERAVETRRERDAFVALCARLRVREWRIQHPERYAALRARWLRSDACKRYRKQRQRVEFERRWGAGQACKRCGVLFSRTPWRRGKVSYCMPACAQAARDDRGRARDRRKNPDAPEPTVCACGCGAAIVRVSRRGFSPRYASRRCRNRFTAKQNKKKRESAGEDR